MDIMKILKNFVYVVALCAMMIAGGCSKDRSADVRGMLQTIPADASMVAVADIETLAKETGCKIDGSKVIVSENVKNALTSSSQGNNTSLVALLESGAIEPSVAALFAEGYNTYLTGYVADTDKLKEWAEKEFGENFAADGDSETCGNILVNGDRFWVCTSSRNTINAQDVKHFKSLSEKQSILVNDVVASLETLDHTLAGWGDIKGCLNAMGMDFATRATAAMMIEAIFTDAVEFSWSADIEKEGIEADMNILNTKGGIAKFNFPTSKIDPSVIESLNCTASAIAAIGVSPDMIKKLKEETGTKSLSVLGMVAGMLQCVDGTCAVASSGEDTMSGIISTTGHGTSDLSQLLQDYSGMQVSMEGKMMRFGKGEVSGDLTSQTAAAKLKGAMAGVVISGDVNKESKFETITFTLHPEKGGLSAHIDAAWKK